METASSETRAETDQQMAFPKPRWMRVLYVICGLIALGIPSLIQYGLIQGQNVNPIHWLCFVLFCVCLSVLSFLFSGPDDIYFDFTHKTYRWVRGWPFFAQTRSGTWEDLWGVYVGRTQGRAAYYCVGVTWWGGGGSVTLRRFNASAPAERFAADLMSKLELQRVMPPRNLRPQP